MTLIHVCNCSRDPVRTAKYPSWHPILGYCPSPLCGFRGNQHCRWFVHGHGQTRAHALHNSLRQTCTGSLRDMHISFETAEIEANVTALERMSCSFEIPCGTNGKSTFPAVRCRTLRRIGGIPVEKLHPYGTLRNHHKQRPVALFRIVRAPPS